MIYISIALLGVLLTYAVRLVAFKKAILDIPNHRSSHAVPTPRGGGIAIVIIFYLGMAWLWYTSEIDKELGYALLCAVPVAVVGVLDDLYDLSALPRFLVQLFAAICAIWVLDISWYLFIPAVILLVWFTNLFNFLDGIDGYVAVEAIFVSVVGYLFFYQPALLVLAASVAGFLPFNWQKASIFMGDVGSTFIGFVIAVIFFYESSNLTDLTVWLLLTSTFWFDATYTLIRRFIGREKVTQAHRKHLFQRAVQSGFSHRKVTLGLLGINLCIWSMLVLFENHLWAVVILSMITYSIIAYYIEKKVAFDVA